MPEPLTLTVDDVARRRMVTDLWLHNLRTLRGTGALNFALAGCVVLLVWHTVVGALVVVGLLLLGRVAWWWIRLTRNLGKRLPTGQVISLGHTATGDLVIRDTDEVWLPRGSATLDLPLSVEISEQVAAPLANLTLPLDLFTPWSLQLLTTAVPRSF